MRALSKRAGFASRGRETDVMREAFGVKLYTLQEAAEMLGASVQRLHAMRRQGVLAAIPLKSEGRAWEYHVTAAAIRAAMNTPAPPPTPSAAPPPPVTEAAASVEARDKAARAALRALGVKCAPGVITPNTPKNGGKMA